MAVRHSWENDLMDPHPKAAASRCSLREALGQASHRDRQASSIRERRAAALFTDPLIAIPLTGENHD